MSGSCERLLQNRHGRNSESVTLLLEHGGAAEARRADAFHSRGRAATYKPSALWASYGGAVHVSGAGGLLSASRRWFSTTPSRLELVFRAKAF